ncbi:MAG: hypothetical protein AUH08_01320 [Verrucomicrobia bacterium 13_2_20CM_54_12]|nr:MAG: hypothetical protein AUH08_01320 [Verrucomicrobia bacterium 13_2_20CM_54_12]OLD73907.1 MAG: hypothetical protein AUF68_02240 [Verrucomicrobia bacterium 13_1_20CM_54_28]OLD85608.1 MAG: hypothetical protein AUG81_12485 [Verrucomicrobia bacterium 13_1_20CM_4_54_11]PYK12520.1 MAG: hypothetical protein DME64_16340 [Verrucomicrobiota bacterium]
MRWLSKVAKRKQVGVADVIYEAIESFVAKCEAEAELETKIINFPTSLHNPTRHAGYLRRILSRSREAGRRQPNCSRKVATANGWPTGSTRNSRFPARRKD